MPSRRRRCHSGKVCPHVGQHGAGGRFDSSDKCQMTNHKPVFGASMTPKPTTKACQSSGELGPFMSTPPKAITLNIPSGSAIHHIMERITPLLDPLLRSSSDICLLPSFQRAVLSVS